MQACGSSTVKDMFRLKERGWVIGLSDLSGFFVIGNLMRWEAGELGLQETPVRGIAMNSPRRLDGRRDILIALLPEEIVQTLIGHRVAFFSAG